ncbi:MAG: dihydrolipoyl dehydrogenase [Solirubrobacterales bacterium]
MVVGEVPEPVDLLVVGAGPGGYVAAARAAELGREVVVVDREGIEGGLGGACLRVGCIPSKALIELAHAYETTRDAGRAGLRVSGAEVDLGAFQDWRGEIVTKLEGGVGGLLRRHRVRYLVGEVSFSRPDRAVVAFVDGNSSFLEFKQAIVATGSRPLELSALPVDGERVLTATGALALTAVPPAMAIVGGGYIGLEIGTAFAKLGAKVTIVEALDQVLPTFAPSLVRPVLRSLENLGVDLRLGTLATGLDGDALVVTGADGEERIEAEKIVIAVGRTPNTDGLGLQTTGARLDDKGLVEVDERRLATPDIAAIGDVTAGPALAHKASAEAIVAAEALCGLPSAFEPLAIPAVVFTDPEIASVGMTLEEAKKAGLDAVQAKGTLASNGRAATLDADDGFTQVVVDRAADRVVGVHMVGPHASELIAAGALATEMIASPADVFGTIHPHPTLSEGLHAAAEQLVERAPVAVGGDS